MPAPVDIIASLPRQWTTMSEHHQRLIEQDAACGAQLRGGERKSQPREKAKRAEIPLLRHAEDSRDTVVIDELLEHGFGGAAAEAAPPVRARAFVRDGGGG